MITADEYSNVTLYDEDDNVVATAKSVTITPEDDLCKGHRLTDLESLSLYYNDYNRALSFIVDLPLKDRIKLKFIMLMYDIKNKLFPSCRI